MNIMFYEVNENTKFNLYLMIKSLDTSYNDNKNLIIINLAIYMYQLLID